MIVTFLVQRGGVSFIFAMLSLVPRASSMLAKCSTTNLCSKIFYLLVQAQVFLFGQLFLFLIIILCVYVLSACVFVCNVHVWCVQKSSEVPELQGLKLWVVVSRHGNQTWIFCKNRCSQLMSWVSAARSNIYIYIYISTVQQSRLFLTLQQFSVCLIFYFLILFQILKLKKQMFISKCTILGGNEDECKVCEMATTE